MAVSLLIKKWLNGFLLKETQRANNPGANIIAAEGTGTGAVNPTTKSLDSSGLVKLMKPEAPHPGV
jgi:hypothetical protein